MDTEKLKKANALDQNIKELSGNLKSIDSMIERLECSGNTLVRIDASNQNCIVHRDSMINGLKIEALKWKHEIESMQEEFDNL